ncbi:hypothetical protein BCE75_10612 [Isoptericola sp. CG 20/1183]|uniref:Uncharacterized protein n=1 Tax=Isoptericola halotolerans TaxID=300560 RepID=A0ABX5EGD7_9MICO|nr:MULTISPECIES: hypothetical protein [Isoptericola]PRZ06547.1 hypothetical protein BCL65_106222 [Isoptericola halotolerans]PRZ06647.1 hypothetical protein BCE75_10612 [Isoptericola sp. CG 20/1183]
MPEAPPPVAVHLGTHRPTVRAVRAWCGTHRDVLAERHVTTRTSWSDLRAAVPGLDWRSDKGRERLRGHLVADESVLFSSSAPLGPAYLPRGGTLFPHADAGIDGLAAALAGVPWSVQLTLAAHADVVTSAWVATVRHGHLVDLDTYWSALEAPSWVPIVQRLVATVGADRVSVHDASAVRTAGDPAGTTAAVGRSVLTSAFDRLTGRTDDLPLADVTGVADTRWSARQIEVALTALPHLRSHDERRALTHFVDRQVDDGGTPAQPLTPDQEAALAARDEADLARVRDLVEVR